MKDLQWFLDREGSYIMRGTTEVFVASEIKAKELFKLQDEEGGYLFSEKLIIHRARPEPCDSCSS
jgi:hypothetical protein